MFKSRYFIYSQMELVISSQFQKKLLKDDNRSQSKLIFLVSGSPLSQPVRPHYSDGASSTNFPNLPSPRDLSLELFTEEVVVPLSEKYTVLLPYFSK